MLDEWLISYKENAGSEVEKRAVHSPLFSTAISADSSDYPPAMVSRKAWISAGHQLLQLIPGLYHCFVMGANTESR